MSGPPGAIRNLTATGGNGGAFFSFFAPVVTGSSEVAVSYSYYLTIDGFPSLAAIWAPPANNLVGPFDIPYYDTLSAGRTVIMYITPNGATHGSGPESSISCITLSSITVSFPVQQLLTTTDTLTITGAKLSRLLSAQEENLPAAIAADAFSSKIGDTATLAVTVKAGANSANILAAPPDIDDSDYVSLVASADAQVDPGFDVVSGYSLSGTDVNTGASVEVTWEVTVPELADDRTITEAQAWVNNNGTAEYLADFSVAANTDGTTTLTLELTPQSIYLIYVKTSSGTTVTIPVENNQAYNNYLHDESGYQNRRENRLLTSGFYRGPVDSSTLTRIRSANGVLLGVNGVPGGMRGSRCCR